MQENDRQIELRARYIVSGRVQGVGFRWSAVQEARALGLRGWVRNCADGTVDTAVAGGAEDVARFRQWLEKGPPGARVREVRELGATDDPLPDSFEIVR